MRYTYLHSLSLHAALPIFPRNWFRGPAIAFATDALALAAATRLVDAGDDSKLAPLQRSFVYLPFEHAESLAMQNRSVQLFETLASAHAQMNNVLDYARRHREDRKSTRLNSSH